MTARYKRLTLQVIAGILLLPSIALGDQTITTVDGDSLVIDSGSASAPGVATATQGDFRTLVVDGDPSDWAGIPALITDPAGDYGSADLVSVRVANDDDFVYFLKEFAVAPVSYSHLLMDTDLDPATGCGAYGIGFEFGLTYSPDGSNDQLGDARDCAWGDDFPGDLVAARGGVYTESSVPIATLEVLTPGLSAFDLAAANDTVTPARYILASEPGDEVGGTVTGEDGGWVLCRNRTTGQSVSAALRGATSWSCEALGLGVSPGDIILQYVIGRAR